MLRRPDPTCGEGRVRGGGRDAARLRRGALLRRVVGARQPPRPQSGTSPASMAAVRALLAAATGTNHGD